MIIHSPIISGSLTFADGATVTYPEGGVYSGSFSGSIQGDTFTGGAFTGDGSGLTFGGTGIVSSSAQLDVISGSQQVEFNDINNNPFTQGASSVTTSKSIIPSSLTLDLGSSTYPFRDLYLSSASLYIDGTQVISSNTNELILSTDANQSLKILETGADTITLQAQNGDITLTTTGTGNIELDAPIQIGAGNQILSSDGNAIQFGEDINVQGNITLTGTVDGVDVAALSDNVTAILSGSQADKDSFAEIVSLINSVDTGNDEAFASFYTSSNQRMGSLEDFTSSIDSTIKTKLNSDLVVSGSATAVRSFLNVEDGADNSPTLGIAAQITVGTPIGYIELTGTKNHELVLKQVNAAHEISNLTTDYVSEGSGSVYYTDARVKTKLNAENVISSSAQITITESQISDLDHYTNADFDARLATKTTTDLDEGTNKYYTDARVKSYLDSQNVNSGSYQGSITLSQVSDVTATAAEVNVLDGITASTAELNYVDGVTSNIQSQLNSKLATATYSTDSASFDSRIDGLESDSHENPLTFADSTTIDFTRTGDSITADVIGGVVSGSAQVDHDATTNFVSDEHINHANVTLTAGAGLTGGGDITDSRTFNVGEGDGISVAADSVGVDGTVLRTTTTFGGDVSGTYNNIIIADDSHNHIIGNIDGLQAALNSKVDENSAITAGTATKITFDSKGLVTGGTSLSASDIPNLDASKITTGTIDPARLPSYVDDVVEAADFASLPATGSTGKIYVTLDTGDIYRWSGSAYVQINDSVSSADQATKLATARTITIGSTGKTFDGTGNVSWTLGEIGAQAAGTYNTIIGTDTDISYTGATVLSTLTLTDGVVQGHTSRTLTVADLGLTATTTELNYVDGVTSSIQGQLNGKLGSTAKAADSNLLDGLDSSAFLRSNANDTASGVITFSNTTASTSTTTGAVKIAGGLGVGGDAFVGGDVVAYASSDERLKKNIEIISKPIDKVMELRGVTWNWKDEASEAQKATPAIGVIAQDVEKVLPQLVDTRDNGFKAVDYGKMVGLLIEAIKDQQKQIDELKSRLQ